MLRSSLEMAKLPWQAEGLPTNAGTRHDLVGQALSPNAT